MKEEHTPGRAHDAGGIQASTSTIVVIALAFWVAASLAVGASGVLEAPPNPLPVAFIWGPVSVFLVVFVRSRPFRAWTLDINLRWLNLYSTVRVAVGVEFLLMSGRELPSEFAVAAGSGDVAVGTALVVRRSFRTNHYRDPTPRRICLESSRIARHADGLRHRPAPPTLRRRSERYGRTDEVSAVRSTNVRRALGSHHALRHFRPAVAQEERMNIATRLAWTLWGADRVTRDLVAAVELRMQPASAWLWLRESRQSGEPRSA